MARKGGVIAKVLGDPDHAVSQGGLCGLCGIAYNGVFRDEGQRLATPLCRVGAKGEGRFEPVSWDVALAEIAARFTALADAGEAGRILHTHYTGTVGLIGGWYPIRFFNRLGATEVDPDTVCNKAARKRGTRIVVVDPIGHKTAQAADLHLKLLPGTDAALAFAFLHVIRSHGLVDQAFLDAHVLGADELLEAIDAMTPARASGLCGVPEEAIVEAALAYAGGPSLL